MTNDPKKTDSTSRWFIETLIKLLAAGAGIAAIVALFSKHTVQQTADPASALTVHGSASTAQYLPPSPHDFVGIRIAQQDSKWKDRSDELPQLLALFDGGDDETMQRRYYVYACLKAAELFFNLPFAQEDPTFDVTFVNNTGADLTVTAVGAALDVGKLNDYSGGTPEPAPIPVVARLVLDIPRHVTEEWPHEPLGFPAEHNQPLDTPQFLTPGTAFRYTIRLSQYVQHVPQAVIMRLTVTTSRGIAYSKRIYMEM
jgi:hypothetical protein